MKKIISVLLFAAIVAGTAVCKPFGKSEKKSNVIVTYDEFEETTTISTKHGDYISKTAFLGLGLKVIFVRTETSIKYFLNVISYGEKRFNKIIFIGPENKIAITIPDNSKEKTYQDIPGNEYTWRTEGTFEISREQFSTLSNIKFDKTWKAAIYFDGNTAGECPNPSNNKSFESLIQYHAENNLEQLQDVSNPEVVVQMK